MYGGEEGVKREERRSDGYGSGCGGLLTTLLLFRFDA